MPMFELRIITDIFLSTQILVNKHLLHLHAIAKNANHVEAWKRGTRESNYQQLSKDVINISLIDKQRLIKETQKTK